MQRCRAAFDRWHHCPKNPAQLPAGGTALFATSSADGDCQNIPWWRRHHAGSPIPRLAETRFDHVQRRSVERIPGRGRSGAGRCRRKRKAGARSISCMMMIRSGTIGISRAGRRPERRRPAQSNEGSLDAVARRGVRLRQIRQHGLAGAVEGVPLFGIRQRRDGDRLAPVEADQCRIDQLVDAHDDVEIVD